MKKYFNFIIFFLLTFLLLVIIKITEPKAIDWSLSFSKDDKIPYGSFVVYKVLPELFSKGIYISDYPVYNFLKERNYKSSNYIFINNSFNPDELDIEKLLDYVKEGNNVFIAANYFGGKLSDTLKVFTNVNYVGNDSIKVNFLNQKLKNKKHYIFKNAPLDYYFINFDSSNVLALGNNSKYKTNFVKIRFGKGSFYLNTVPIAFTNYNILNHSNEDYIYKALSYLPAGNKTFWDEYYKTGKAVVKTPLKFILSTQPLRWAYYILIFSIILYIIFEGKRKQRIIPQIKPLKNTTLEFTELIGKLYYQQKNHKNIAGKMINYFSDQIRIRYFIRIDENKEEAIEKISRKSGVEAKQVRSILNYISYIEIKSRIKENELEQINSLIESFYKKAGLYGRTN